MKRVAVLLTVHNRKQKTIQCLSNLFSQSGINSTFKLYVFLTDDGCSDGTPDEVRRLFPDVTIISGDGTLFWNRGMYVAWQEAAKQSYDYFLWLNDDTYLLSDAIFRIINISSTNPKAIFVGSTSDTKDDSIITYGGMDKGKQQVFSISESLPCYYMHGNFVLIPNKVYKVVGMNDPVYRHTLGDHDYGLMALKKGIEVLVAPGIYGRCDRHDTIATWKNPQKSLHQRISSFFKPNGRNPFEFFYFRKKHFGFLPACFTFITNFIHVLFPRFWKSDDYR